METDKIVVVGAGLCGTLLAVRLAQRGFAVEVYERRPDPRRTTAMGGMSINLALSNRGLRALRLAGIEDLVLRGAVPMYGRMVHHAGGQSHLLPYSGYSEKCINSIGRQDLNNTLLNVADGYPNLRLHFNACCIGLDGQRGEVQFRDEQTGKVKVVRSAAVFGADGVGSVVRRQMADQGGRLRFNFSQQFLEHGYKEIRLTPEVAREMGLARNLLHIWPRRQFMLIALPNADGSFTATLFLPYAGPGGFDALDTTSRVRRFFGEHFPEIPLQRAEVVDGFLRTPAKALGTIKCYPWQMNDKVLLVGDAAHAIVPFYGQGMNCAFEDVTVLDTCLDRFGDDWPAVFAAFQADRKRNTDAIAALALDNFREMCSHVADPVFLRKRKMEVELEKQYGDFASKYSLVTFNETVPYAEALRIGRAQDEALLDICARQDVEALPLASVMNLLRERMATAGCAGKPVAEPELEY